MTADALFTLTYIVTHSYKIFVLSFSIIIDNPMTDNPMIDSVEDEYVFWILLQPLIPVALYAYLSKLDGTYISENE